MYSKFIICITFFFVIYYIFRGTSIVKVPFEVHVAKETNELIVIFSGSDRKVRFDIPKSEITFTGSSVIINNTADKQKYKVYRYTPLPQDNKSFIPTVTAEEDDAHLQRKEVLDRISNTLLTNSSHFDNIMALWHYSIVDGIKIYNEFAWMLQKHPRTGLTSFGIPQQEEKKEKRK
jgi:hypothetical protein